MAPRSDPTSAPPVGVPELELDLPATNSQKPTPKRQPEAEHPLELAVDPRALVQERLDASAPPIAQSLAAIPPLPRVSIRTPLAAAPDIDFDARLLADYGEPPRHWLFSPLYAYRVLKRRHALKRDLAGRREEAERAAGEAEDALVAFAERARSAAEAGPLYSQALEELHRAEELLRSRDRVLAADQDAQNSRLGQIDARLSNLEADLARAQGAEQSTLAQLADARGELGREEARLKRAEIEVRAAHQRTSGSGTPE
jgi:hypothetical protein